MTRPKSELAVFNFCSDSQHATFSAERWEKMAAAGVGWMREAKMAPPPTAKSKRVVLGQGKESPA
jgi:hypothetical protein